MTPEQPATILTIEDDDAVRLSIVAYLEDRGYRVIQAENGRVGLETFQLQCPDLVLVDLRMPEVDGLEVLAAVRRDSPDTPTIVVSGTGVITDAVEALHRGAWDYILKPIEDMEILRHSIRNALHRASLIRENREYQEHLEEEIRSRTAELLIANEALRQEIDQRKRSQRQREQLIEELEARNAELERFSYTVSHDLKTPLITINGYLGVLREDIAKGNVTEVQNDLDRISTAANRMYHLLRDLLELSRVGQVANPPTDVDLAALSREAIEVVRGEMVDQELEIQIRADLPVIRGDRTRLLEVMQNLIENAVKYTGDQDRPRVEIGTRHDGEEIVCFVSDNGIGIDPRYQQKIFGLFEQLDPEVDGSGVGLALVKRIVEFHGGRIWVESEGEGRGATFCFTIPPEPPADDA